MGELKSWSGGIWGIRVLLGIEILDFLIWGFFFFLVIYFILGVNKSPFLCGGGVLANEAFYWPVCISCFPCYLAE